MSKNSNVLASNPLDFMLSSSAARSETEPPPEPKPAPKPAPVVAMQAPETGAPETKPEPEIRPALPEALREVPNEAPPAPAPRRRKRPVRKAAAKPDASPEQQEGEGARSRANRIGTIQQPYTRTDGVQTRQASVTLPVDLLKRLGHCSIDTGMKTSQIVRAALEDYFEAQGY